MATENVDSVSWEIDRPYATDPVLLGDLFKVLGGLILGVAILFLVFSRDVLATFQLVSVIGGIFGGSFLIAWILMLIFARRLRERFTLASEGPRRENIDTRDQIVRGVVGLLLCLVGKPGAAILTTSDQGNLVAVEFSPQDRSQ